MKLVNTYFIIVAIFLVFVLQPQSTMEMEEQLLEDTMAITQSTLKTIIGFEGFKTKAYKDTQGYYTIGVGHLIKPNEKHLLNTTLTEDQVKALLQEDLNICDETIKDVVKVPLNQNQYDALYSLCFNIGTTKFRTSSVVRRLNTGDYAGAAEAILMWNKPQALVKRRKAEKALFLASA